MLIAQGGHAGIKRDVQILPQRPFQPIPPLYQFFPREAVRIDIRLVTPVGIAFIIIRDLRIIDFELIEPVAGLLVGIDPDIG